ncbi:type I methionyl aminopeptidase [Pacificimonas flava]|uniref:Methionine aminopeptidase n=2 Tax=Pacificimonas TaxID=1960290 RepID=A0A219B3F7_9SPHN|nr:MULTISPECIES: type I methionyl aminopeptidase [Pacificimonas]MBZ6377444.1 type I methionyl aminopeptidase [Pacificimonas aurantium]OWV32855.1 type I methionyl aminopeptidase [Pacificimonas flava]
MDQLVDDMELSEDGIRLYGPAAFEGMRRAGRLAAEALDMIAPHVVPGAVTRDLDDMIYDFVKARGAVPATIFYRGYSHSSCISVNHVVCHGIPGPKKLQKGDIANIDITVVLDGWHGDTSRMFPVGPVSKRAERLIDITYECLMRGIAVAKPGATVGDIGHAIQTFAEGERCSVVRDFCGHGLGRVFHSEPSIVHAGRPGQGPELRPGMFFTIEPMINLGRHDVKILSDGWTAVTRDRQLSAQFEHSIGITTDGAEVFTTSPQGLHCPPYNR